LGAKSFLQQKSFAAEFSFKREYLELLISKSNDSKIQNLSMRVGLQLSRRVQGEKK
jgi:hypothetical protein